jgi:hypothetical protein
MDRPVPSLPQLWTARRRNGAAPRPSGRRPDLPPFASRPGIATRWKPRDRVSAAGN